MEGIETPGDGCTRSEDPIMKCPQCGCQEFYAKDPADPFETYRFMCPGGEDIIPDPDNFGQLDITLETEAFCDRCSWHGRLETIKST